MKNTKKKIRPFFQDGPFIPMPYYMSPSRSFYYFDNKKWSLSCKQHHFERMPKLTKTAARKRWPEIFKSKLPE